jgi:hypothetical protein
MKESEISFMKLWRASQVRHWMAQAGATAGATFRAAMGPVPSANHLKS